MPPVFLTRLRNLLEIGGLWCPCGTKFRLRNDDALAELVERCDMKCMYYSLIRQLHYYDFKRVEGAFCWGHPKFNRWSPEVMFGKEDKLKRLIRETIVEGKKRQKRRRRRRRKLGRCFPPLEGVIDAPDLLDEYHAACPFHEVWLYAEELPPIEVEMGSLEMH